MDVRYGAIVAGFGHQHTACVRVKSLTKYIKKEVTLPYKAHTKCVAVFWLRGGTVMTSTPEVFYPIVVGFKQCVDIGLHVGEVTGKLRKVSNVNHPDCQNCIWSFTEIEKHSINPAL